MPTSDSPSQSFLSSVELAANNTSPDQKHDFWFQDGIEAVRWNAIFPYQLLVVRKGQHGWEEDGRWSFTLPFPPSSIGETWPFAVAGAVTQGGFVEEHSGVPIRNISFGGTLGVLPMRGAADNRPTANFAGAILGGTVEQARRTAVAAQGFASNFTGINSAFQENLVPESEFSNNTGGPTAQAGWIGRTSGFYQMQLLKRFLENYHIAKTKSENKDLRLALCMWKQQAVYLVQVTGFTASQSADSPLEYTYSLTFKAWRRISLDSSNVRAANQYVPAPRAPNAMARVLKGILDARDVLENAKDILSAVVGDIDAAVFTPIRETSLFVKDLLGVPPAFTDLPSRVLKDAQASVVQYVAIREQFGATAPEAQSRSFDETNNGLSRLVASKGTLRRSPVGLKVGSKDTDDLDDVSDAYDPFRNPEDNYDYFKDKQPGQIKLAPRTIASIQAERVRVRQLTRRDFEAMRDRAKQAMADFADAVGAGHAFFNATYQRPAIQVAKTPTADDYRVLFAMNKFIAQLNKLAATTETQAKRLTSVDYVAGLARQAGMAFREPRSKYLVPFPYGYSLEQLATRYLKDPDRWVEIATLNGLRSPYVDETGFQIPLLAPGVGNEVVVASVDNLYVNQLVYLVATDTPKTARRIKNIISESEDLHTLVLDGDADLSRFTVDGLAVVHAYLPDTVNSQMSLYIPSEDEPQTEAYQSKEVPGLDTTDKLLAAGGVDFLLTDTNDLALAPDGSVKLAIGLQNIIQGLRIKLSLYRGSLNRHPEIGLPIRVGDSLADMSAKDIAKSIRSMLADDPVITGVQSVAVERVGGYTKVTMAVTVKGQAQLIPISLDIRR